MTLKGYLKLKRHKAYLLNRVLQLRHTIFQDALNGNGVSEVDRILFLKYNDRLRKISKYSF